MEVGSKSTFKPGSHIIVTVVRMSHEYCQNVARKPVQERVEVARTM